MNGDRDRIIPGAGAARADTHFVPVLGLWRLVLFGLAFIGPTAPYTFYGVGSLQSQGHLALVYVIAFIAVSFTAVSYGRMASAFPAAGSAYTYASRALSPLWGLLTGWLMLLDYLLLPLLCIVIVADFVHNLVPEIPHAVIALMTAALTTFINARGIQLTSRFTIVFTVVLVVSVVWFLASSLGTLVRDNGTASLLSTRPFFDPASFSWNSILAATPVAIISFLGFDGIASLAEEARNPRTTVPLATLLVCVICASVFVLLTYVAQLAWPDYRSIVAPESAFSDIARRVGGPFLGATISAIVIGQAWSSAVTSQASASRMLFGIARDGWLPRRIFGYLSPQRRAPTYSIILIGAVAAVGASMLSLDTVASFVSFGACAGFISVNICVIAWFFFRQHQRAGRLLVGNLLLPLCGVAVCVWIWTGSSAATLRLGAAWLVCGILVYVFTRCSRGKWR